MRQWVIMVVIRWVSIAAILAGDHNLNDFERGCFHRAKCGSRHLQGRDKFGFSCTNFASLNVSNLEKPPTLFDSSMSGKRP
uniref:Secreted protein n=1 Tax=Nephila pilipes TaxID=299642 RepID=A0A8X6TEN2_NEPPI|nr:hypothetical protein NPIL_84221 [Nephila pilipes]